MDLSNLLIKNPNLSSLIWPEKLFIDEYLWKKLELIHKWSESDRHEYEISLFNVDNDNITSPIKRGSQTNVRTSHSASVKYKFDPKTKTYLKEMISDNEVVRTKLIKQEELPKQIQVNYLLNFHTHPSYDNGTYSFFSDRDINTLLSSNAKCIGVITDKVYLVGKKPGVPQILNQTHAKRLNQLSAMYYWKKEENEINQQILDLFGELNLLLYQGKLNGTLNLVK